MKWIYHYYCDDFDKMTNLSTTLRSKLSSFAEIRAPRIIEEKISFDGTIKWSMEVDDQRIETVYIPGHKRSTVCISSQIGCALKCSFCGTGQQGFSRNLCVSEIIGQVWRASKIIFLNQRKDNYQCFNFPISHIVFMGMGEPLLNFINVVSAIKIMSDDFGFGISRKKIVISTAGIVPGINRLKGVLDVVLAISLHAPNDTIRNEIMPINKKYNISSLLAAGQSYLQWSTVNRGGITIEYVLLDHINDEILHAHQLAQQLKNIPCKVNLIPWNQIPNVQHKSSTFLRIQNFFKILSQCGIVTIIRKIRGSDINAACGQLTGSVINRIQSTVLCQKDQ